MRKSKIVGWICGLAQGKNEYKINNVTFVVESRLNPLTRILRLGIVSAELSAVTLYR
jgi:hypothetical protein